MEASMAINSFRDLRVWQAGMDLVEEVYLLTQTFPKHEIYGLTSQPNPAGGGFCPFKYCGRTYAGT